MREPLWNEHLVPFRSGNPQRGPMREAGRATPDINGNVEDRAFDHPNELVLSVRWQLVMQTPQYPRCNGTGVVVLNEIERHAMFGKQLRTPCF